MIRNFTLEEITFEEFNGLCKCYNIPPDKHDCYHNQPKKYTRILEPELRYTFEELVENAPNNFQHLRTLWIPGDIAISDANRLTSNDFDNYLRKLKEKLSNKLVIQLSSRRRRNGGRPTDIYEFQKKEGVWLLRYFHIRHPNFGFYTFNGLDNSEYMSSHAISGIYNQDTIR